MILFNADVGEHDQPHHTDDTLIPLLDIVNISCGGHAGSKETAEHCLALAKAHNVTPCVHVSYPDRENFGRTMMELELNALKATLDEQRTWLPNVPHLKFHGALYHAAAYNQDTAQGLSDWLQGAGFTAVLCPPGSDLAEILESRGITVLREGFIERRYCLEGSSLQLVSRTQRMASINIVENAIAQAKCIIDRQEVYAYETSQGIDNEMIERGSHPLHVDTVCIHSDSPIAVELTRAVRQHWPKPV